MAHAFEIVTSTTTDSNATSPAPEPPELKNVMSDRVEQNVKGTFTAVLENQESPLSEVVPEDTNGTTHIRGHYRFDDSHPKSDVVDSLIADVANDAEWYEIREHDCTHDGAGGPCGDWMVAEDSNGNTAQKGTIPDDV